MTPVETLALVGEALYGPRWRRPVARAVGIPEWHIREMVAGKRELPADHPAFETLARMLEHRSEAYSQAAIKLNEMTKVGA